VEKVLLDSTYLLPIFGVAVKGIERVLEVLESLHRSRAIKIYYTCFNILEIISKISKMQYSVRMVEMGINSIMESFQQAYPKPQSYMKALRLKSMGFNDLIDLLLYTTSVDNSLKMLTRDKDLLEFLRKSGEGEAETTIVMEEEFLRNYK
jgi:hypothetical protein